MKIINNELFMKIFSIKCKSTINLRIINYFFLVDFRGVIGKV